MLRAHLCWEILQAHPSFCARLRGCQPAVDEMCSACETAGVSGEMPPGLESQQQGHPPGQRGLCSVTVIPTSSPKPLLSPSSSLQCLTPHGMTLPRCWCSQPSLHGNRARNCTEGTGCKWKIFALVAATSFPQPWDALSQLTNRPNARNERLKRNTPSQGHSWEGVGIL